MKGRLVRLGRRLRHMFARRAIVLAYHRIAEEPRDPQLLAVSPAHFAEHLEVLRRKSRPLDLDGLAAGTLEHGATAITFDDGYTDNLAHAKPVLERHAWPATVFVASGGVGQEREFWWDDLERLLLGPAVLPPSVRVTIGNTVHTPDARPAQDDRNAEGWTVMDDRDPAPGPRLYRALCVLLRPLPEEDRRRAVDELRRQLGGEEMARPSRRVLAPAELLRLAEGGLVSIGAHTVSHSVLSSLPPEAQRREIAGSKKALEEILGRPVHHFAYPYGARSDYTAQTVEIVRTAGFRTACTTESDVVLKYADPYQVPRMLVRNWDGDTFARRWEAWLRG